MIRVIVILIGITLLGALLRFINLTPFTVYPDSFQNLVVADNINHYGKVVGYLGNEGLFYPDYFMWTRPVYPLLILVVSFFHVSLLASARLIAYVLGVLAIPIAYLFIKAVFKKAAVGLIAAFLLTTSYNHTIWSGMPMTESIGVFFLLLFLWRFFITVDTEASFKNWQIMITGFLFSLSVLSRYEYLILSIPILFLTLQKSQKPFRYLLILFASVLVGIILFGFILFPINEIFQVILNQLSYLFIKIVISIAVLLSLFFIYRFSPLIYKKRIQLLFPYVIKFLLALSFIYIVIQIISGDAIEVFGIHLDLMENFIQHDLLLGFFGFIGLLSLLNDNKKNAIAYFVLLSISFLIIIYYQINPDMERYVTHIIPFLLITASYGVNSFFQKARIKKYRYIIYFVFTFFIILQLIITSWGLRYLNDSSWYHQSYEEKAATRINPYLKGGPLLITSSPEPYFYFTGLDTQSITDTYPFLYLPSISNKQKVMIIEDMGMHVLFPHFSKVVDKRLSKYKIGSFYVNERYHYQGSSVSENHPVILYVLSLKDLIKQLQK